MVAKSSWQCTMPWDTTQVSSSAQILMCNLLKLLCVTEHLFNSNDVPLSCHIRSPFSDNCWYSRGPRKFPQNYLSPRCMCHDHAWSSSSLNDTMPHAGSNYAIQLRYFETTKINLSCIRSSFRAKVNGRSWWVRTGCNIVQLRWVLKAI